MWAVFRMAVTSVVSLHFAFVFSLLIIHRDDELININLHCFKSQAVGTALFFFYQQVSPRDGERVLRQSHLQEAFAVRGFERIEFEEPLRGGKKSDGDGVLALQQNSTRHAVGFGKAWWWLVTWNKTYIS